MLIAILVLLVLSAALFGYGKLAEKRGQFMDSGAAMTLAAAFLALAVLVLVGAGLLSLVNS